ncbi:unnamed protein product [Boreogadus saida]
MSPRVVFSSPLHHVSERTVSQRVVCLGGVNSESSCSLQFTTSKATGSDEHGPSSSGGTTRELGEALVHHGKRRLAVGTLKAGSRRENPAQDCGERARTAAVPLPLQHLQVLQWPPDRGSTPPATTPPGAPMAPGPWQYPSRYNTSRCSNGPRTVAVPLPLQHLQVLQWPPDRGSTPPATTPPGAPMAPGPRQYPSRYNSSRCSNGPRTVAVPLPLQHLQVLQWPPDSVAGNSW